MGDDTEKQQEWNPSSIAPGDIKVIKRQPRPTKAGSMTFGRINNPRVGVVRTASQSVGSVLNVSNIGHEGSTGRPTEVRALSRVDEED